MILPSTRLRHRGPEARHFTVTLPLMILKVSLGSKLSPALWTIEIDQVIEELWPLEYKVPSSKPHLSRHPKLASHRANFKAAETSLNMLLSLWNSSHRLSGPKTSFQRVRQLSPKKMSRPSGHSYLASLKIVSIHPVSRQKHEPE